MRTTLKWRLAGAGNVADEVPDYEGEIKRLEKLLAARPVVAKVWIARDKEGVFNHARIHWKCPILTGNGWWDSASNRTPVSLPHRCGLRPGQIKTATIQFDSP